MIGIFDYGVGNLLNLKNAIDHLGLENCIVQNSDELESCSRMLLPGVGAFAPARDWVGFPEKCGGSSIL